MKRIAHVALLYLTACLAAQSATLVLAPVNGALTGPSGSIVGWGFTIGNTTPGAWIEITSARFCSGASGTNTACGAISLGTFTDFVSGFNDIVLGPSPDNTSATQAFSPVGSAGIGSFLITAVSGQATGQIVLTYNVFSRSPHDPNFNPNTDTVSTDSFLTSPASVTVSNPLQTIPTMSTWGLVLMAILLVGFAARNLEGTVVR